MKIKWFMCGISALLIGMVSCKSQQQGTKNSVTAEAELIEKYWKLTELFGEPVAAPQGNKEAYMIFKKEENRVNGNAGCNNFNGTYTLKPDNRILFSQIASTMMMCLNMETETKLKQVFETTDNYVVNGNSLVLNAQATPLARFEVVYMQ